MEDLTLNTLKTLAEARHIVPVKKTRNEYIRLMSNRYETPYGINPSDNPIVIIAELSIIPTYKLLATAEKMGIVFPQDVQKAQIIKEIMDRLGISDDNIDNDINSVEAYWGLPIRQLQHMTGKTTTNRIILVTTLLLNQHLNVTEQKVPFIGDFRKAGVKRLYHTRPRSLKPLKYTYTTVNQLVAGVENGVNLMELLINVPAMPMGALQNAQQALTELKMNYIPQSTSIKEMYIDVITYLTELAKYPPAKWWPVIKEYFIKLTPLQRRQMVQSLDLINSEEEDIETLTDANVNFILTRGFPLQIIDDKLIYQSLPEEVYNLLTTRYSQPPETYEGERSVMESILLNLAMVPDDKLRDAAKKYGIRLPITNPRETLYSTIFLYEWIDPNREPIYQALLNNPPTKVLLEKYDDFELMSVWPGFNITAPQNRRQLLKSCIKELQRDHYLPWDCDTGLAFGTYQEHECLDVIEIPADPHLQLQLTRTCARLTFGDDEFEVIENDVIGYLIEAWVSAPVEDDNDELRTYLLAFTELAMLAFGWNGIGRVNIEQQDYNQDMVAGALNALPEVPEILQEMKLVKYNNDLQVVETETTFHDLKNILNVNNIGGYAISLIQTSCYYFPKLIGELPQEINPFVY